MDYQIFPAYHFSNIPFGVDRKQLAKFLTYFLYGGQEGDQISFDQVQLYARGRRQFAVLRGVSIRFGEIKRLLTLRSFWNNPIFVNYDFGFERNEEGGPYNEPLATRDLFQNFFMLPHGNLHSFFVEDLAQLLANGQFYCRVVMRDVEDIVNWGFIFRVGRVISISYRPEQRVLIINYNSTLEKIQAFCFLNGNRDFSRTGLFENCHINRQIGLGRFGILDIPEINQFYGYIPFSCFNQELIQFPDLSQTFTSCYKCNGLGTLQLLGVTTCLKFYAAKCTACNYDVKFEDPLVAGCPVTYHGESFSRVRIGRNDLRTLNGLGYALNLVHSPLQFRYSNPWEARNVISEIVAHEAVTQETLFTHENRINGTLIDVVQLKENGLWLYLLTFRVAKTHMWHTDNINRFQEVSFDIISRDPTWVHSPLLTSTKTSSVVHIENEYGNCVLVKCRVGMSSPSYFPVIQFTTLYPSANHREYAAVRAVMSDWAHNPGEPRYGFLNDLLIANQAEFNLPPNLIAETPLVVQNLNEDQIEAINTCRNGRLRVVQCPPGTGNYLTLAVTALELARTEDGLILCVTKSNKAADMLCTAIEKRKAMFQENYNETQTVRVGTKRNQEIFFRRLSNVEGNGPRLSYLPDQIASHRLFKNDLELRYIFERMRNVGMDLLSSYERTILNQHINEIEGHIIRNARIIVTTAATLFDGRIMEHLSAPNQLENVNINTVLMLEGGHISMPLSVPILAFHAKRYLIFGDPDQISPIVKSFSAETAGLCISIMQFLRHGVARSNPGIWHTLRLQSTMPGRVCNLLNVMTYNNQLRCSASLLWRQRNEDVTRLVQLVNVAVPETRRSEIVVVAHNYPDEKIRIGSKINSEEAVLVVKLVNKLCRGGVTQDRITLISTFEDQRLFLLQLLFHSSLPGIAVCTPTGFEGKTNDIIIVSMVSSQRENDNGYSQSHQRRLTATICSARQFLFFVVNLGTYAARPNDEMYIQHFREALNEAPKHNIN